MAPVEFFDLAAEISQAISCAAEAVISPDDGDVILHGAADFIPSVIDVNELVGRSGISAFPVWNVGSGWDFFSGRVEAHDLGKRAASHDVPFEKGI